MKKLICVVAVLMAAAVAVAADEPPPEGVLIFAGANSKMLGKVRMTAVEENGQQVEKPDPWVPGNVLIIRELDEQAAAGLKVRDGTPEIGGAYRIRENRELEFVRKVDLTKTNQELAKQFGLKGGKKPQPKPK